MNSSKSITARILSAVLAIMMLFSLVTVGFTASAANVEVAEVGATITGGQTFYLNASGWGYSDARYAMYFCNGSSAATWVDMTLVPGETYMFQGTAPTGQSHANVIFVRMNGATTTNDWANKWNQTADLTWDGTSNCFTPSGWDGSTTTWSTYTPVALPEAGDASTYYLMGTLTDWSTGQNMVYAEDTSVVTTTIEDVAAGEYKLKIKSGDSWMGNGSFTTSIEGGTIGTADTDGNIVVTLDGGTYTFNYSTTSKSLAITFEAAETVDPETPDTGDDTVVASTPCELPYEVTDGLYAYASTEVAGTNAWQRWHEYNSVRYFFLPATASDTEVVILNTYTAAVTVNGVEIPAGEYAVVPYTDGSTYTCSGATTQKVQINKTDAEGTLFVNSADGMVTVNDDDAKTETTVDATYDLYGFLTGGTKNREAKGTAGAVASVMNGVVEDTTVKKIKGRGNTTWSETKKPFNITYDSNIELDGMKGKKWSLLANAKDGSLLHNRLVYDMANEIGMVYACDSRFVDFFVNGYYKGSYQLTQKIEMGKNTVMSDLEEPEVEDVTEDDGTVTPYPTENFDFILELDTEENAANAGDKGYESPEGQWMTYKTPDSPATEQEAFIQAKYNELEAALYGDDMAALEAILDLDDFARAYLINEVSKNIDAGVTSCYFVYSSAAGKFYASPVWDYDNAIGNLPDNGARTDMDGNTLDLDGPTGWYARDLKHYARDARNVFGQAWYNTSTTADGKTFADIVLDVWNAEFADIVDILNGDATANGRLQSYDVYMANLTKTGTFNQKADGAYVTADWKASKTSLAVYSYDAEANTVTSTTKSYDATFLGETEYTRDWTISRINWMAAQYAEAETVVPDGYVVVYFENNWQWPDAKVYYWGSTIGTNPEWSGITLTNVVGQNDQGYDIYEVVIPADITGLIFNGTGEYGAEQSANIEDSSWVNGGICYYMTYDAETNTKPCGTYAYPPVVEETTAAETTAAETTAAETTATETTAATAATKTVYFSNTSFWSEPISAYAWNVVDGTNVEVLGTWPGTEMTWVETNDYGQDVYSIEVPADLQYIIFNGTGGQTADIPATEIADGYGVYITDAEPYYATYQYETEEVEETTTTTASEDEAKVSSGTPATFDPTVDTYYEVSYVASGAGFWTDGYVYTWTAPANGTLTLTADSACADYWIIIENTTSWFDSAALESGNALSTAEFAVTEGTTYNITVGTWSEYSDATVAFWANFEEGSAAEEIQGSGTEADPYIVNFGENNLPDLVYGTETWFQYSGTMMDVLDITISGYNPRMDAFAFKVITQFGASADEFEMDYMGSTTAAGVTPTYPTVGATLFTITNNSMMGGTGFVCTIANAGGEVDTTGTADDPDTLVTGTILAPSVNGPYYYTYTAEEDCSITFNMYSNLNSDGWAIGCSDLDIYSESSFGEGDTITANMTAGQTITLWVANGSFGEGTVYFQADLGETVVEAAPHVYFINGAGWTEVAAYAWTDGGEIAWPGVAMTKTEETVNGFDVYYIEFETEYANIIFNNNNNGSQTADLTFENGKYYDIKSLAWYDSLEDVPALDALATDRYLVGAFNDWNTTANEFKLNAEGEDTGYVTLTLEANTTYEFKVIREGAWTGNSGTITESVAGWVFSSSVSDNCKITTTDAGEYVFGFGVSSSQLSVTYPGQDPVVPDEPATVDETYYIRGAFNGWTDIALEGEGTVLSTTLRIEAGEYGFKLHQGDTWYGNNGTIENTTDVGWTFRTGADENGNEYGNCTLVATGGTYTFTLDTETMKLTITAELDEITTPDEPVAEYFTVIYLNADGSFLGYEKVEAGAAAAGIDAPTMAADAQYTYTFTGWDADLTAISADVVATAQYDKAVNSYTVTFVDKDGNVLDTQTVEYGAAAVAPEAPVVDGYTFKGWDVAYDNITSDITVTAQYSRVPAAVTTGKLTVEVIGGAGFTIAIGDGAARPQGNSYMNTKIALGATVTVVASTTAGNEFLGWVNSNTGVIVSTSETYTFTTAGNDMIKALYRTSVDGVGLVIFKNAKAAAGNGQILDMQYYASTDSISFPEAPSQVGYDFAGWDMTEAEIQAALANGEDVTVTATWTVRLVYVTITVNGGAVTASGGTNDAGQYSAYKATTVTAEAAPAGQKFAYWVDGNGKVKSYNAEYIFYPTGDIELTAVYVTEDETVAKQVLVGIAADNSTDGDRITWVMSWYVPAEVGTFVKGGVLLVETKNYNEATFVHGTTDSNVTDYAPTAAQAAEQEGYGLIKGKSYVGTTWYGCTWVQYTDAVTGELVTLYSETIEATKY